MEAGFGTAMHAPGVRHQKHRHSTTGATECSRSGHMRCHHLMSPLILNYVATGVDQVA